MVVAHDGCQVEAAEFLADCLEQVFVLDLSARESHFGFASLRIIDIEFFANPPEAVVTLGQGLAHVFQTRARDFKAVVHFTGMQLRRVAAFVGEQ